MNDVVNVPNGWEKCQISDVLFIQNGYAFKSNDFYKSSSQNNIHLIKQSQLKGDKVDVSESVFLPNEYLTKYNDYKITKGDILIGMSGSIGKVSFYDYDFDSLLNQRVGKIQLFSKSTFNQRFFGYLLLNIEQEIQKIARGMGVQNVSSKDIENLDFNLPPLNEQNRIVEKIETLFSEIDAGVESLSKAKTQLERYRQSLLKHAFEGKLTAQWRAEFESKNGKPLPTADELIEQIQTARQAHYDKQIKDWELAVKAWENNGKNGKKPTKPNAEFLNISQKSNEYLFGKQWKLTYFEEIYDVYVGSTPSRKSPDFWNGDISWVSSGEVNFSDIHTTKEKITNLGLENASTKIHPIGTVMLAMIGEGKTRGQASILKIEACHNQNTSALRVNQDFLKSEFLYYFLKLNYELTRRIGSGNNQKALNKTVIQGMKIPLCSYFEQVEIVKILDSKLSEVDKSVNEISIQLEKAKLLKSAILHKAFQGKLVPQDPTDLPASQLLDQIKAERLAKQTAKQTAQTATKSKAKANKQPKAKSKAKTKES